MDNIKGHEQAAREVTGVARRYEQLQGRFCEFQDNMDILAREDSPIPGATVANRVDGLFSELQYLDDTYIARFSVYKDGDAALRGKITFVSRAEDNSETVIDSVNFDGQGDMDITLANAEFNTFETPHCITVLLNVILENIDSKQ